MMIHSDLQKRRVFVYTSLIAEAEFEDWQAVKDCADELIAIDAKLEALKAVATPRP